MTAMEKLIQLVNMELHLHLMEVQAKSKKKKEGGNRK